MQIDRRMRGWTDTSLLALLASMPAPAALTLHGAVHKQFKSFPALFSLPLMHGLRGLKLTACTWLGARPINRT